MEVIPRRKRLYATKAGALEAPRQDDVAIQPFSTRGHLREGHSDVERDACLFGKDLDWADLANRGNHRVEQSANPRWLSGKVMLQVMTPTGVRLIAIRELAAASLASPQRPFVSGKPGWWHVR